MKLPYISASRLKTVQDCPLAYALRYDPPNEEAVQVKWAGEHRDNLQAAKLGGNIHDALEEWRRPNPKTGRVRRPVFNQLIKLYDEACVKQEIDFDLYNDGKDMLRRWFDKRQAGAMKTKVLHVEQQFGSHDAPHILSNGVPIFGFIDLTLEHEDGTIELVDYKTQRAPIKQDEADSNIQAGIYLTVARELWPDRPLRFTFDLLRYGTVTTYWTDEKINSFKDWLKSKQTWIESIEEPRATIGPACKWCVFTEICPKAQKLIQTGSWEVVTGRTEPESDDEMLDQLQSIKAAKAILHKKQQALEGIIKNEWFDPHAPPSERVRITDRYSVQWAERSNTVYLPSEVQKLVPAGVFGQMAGLSKAKVERLLPVLPSDVADAVRDSAILKPFKALTIRRRQDAD